MFGSIGSELMIDVDDDASGATFSDPMALSSYDVIVFSNTSGNAILDAEQRTNFEAWMAGGGRVMGIHAASDTYRHSTSNGNNTGAWDYYAELIGASVQENPNHVSGTPSYSMQQIGFHASTANLPDPWVKNEEYYYWEGGYYGPDNTEVLRVEETIGPNGQVNSYDAPRPMSWYRELAGGSRVFYTALGHAPDNYTLDMEFRTHIKDALMWLLDGTTSIPSTDRPELASVHPNPAIDPSIVLEWYGPRPMNYSLFSEEGRILAQGKVTSERTVISIAGLAPGMHTLRIAERSIPVVVMPR